MTEQKPGGLWGAPELCLSRAGAAGHVSARGTLSVPRSLLFCLKLGIPGHSFLCFSAWPHPFGECTEDRERKGELTERAEGQRQLPWDLRAQAWGGSGQNGGCSSRGQFPATHLLLLSLNSTGLYF